MTAVALDLRALTLNELMAGFSQASNEDHNEWFTEIERRMRLRLPRCLLNLGVPESDIEDIIQNTWTAVVQYRDSYRPGMDALTWIRHVAKRETQRAFRDSRRLKRHPAGDLFSIDNDEDDSTDQLMKSPYEQAVDAEEREHIRELVLSLPDRHRDILVMFYFEGLTHKQMADRLGVSIGTVKPTLNSARALMAEILEREESCTRPA